MDALKITSIMDSITIGEAVKRLKVSGQMATYDSVWRFVKLSGAPIVRVGQVIFFSERLLEGYCFGGAASATRQAQANY